MLSTQRRDFYLKKHSATTDDSVVHDNTFNTLINEGYSRVFMCKTLPDQEFREENPNALFLRAPESGQDLIFHRGGELEKSLLSEKQLEEIQKFAQFPEKGYVELNTDVSKKIIPICHCPYEKPPEVLAELNQVYQAYMSLRV